MTDKKPRPEDEIPARLMESAHQAWLAGLAVFETAQREGGRLFDTLAREGSASRSRSTEPPPTGPDPEVRSGAVPGEEAPDRAAPYEPGTQAQGRTSETLERLERLFEDRVQRILARLHVPTREDILALERRINELEQELEAVRAAEAARPRRRTTAKKPPSEAPTAGGDPDIGPTA